MDAQTFYTFVENNLLPLYEKFIIALKWKMFEFSFNKSSEFPFRKVTVPVKSSDSDTDSDPVTVVE
jgi:hypothetical protein